MRTLKKVVFVLASLVALLVVGWLGITTSVPGAPKFRPCSEAWVNDVAERYFDISDGEGHGPDPGSGEWLGSVERKAKLPVRADLADAQRCGLIQQQLERHTFIINQPLGITISF
ncbi:MAG TPA: hypothetical protein VF534_27020 [Paraburkholderia sp.]